MVIVRRAGPIAGHDVLLARFNQDGSLDKSFGGPTGVHTDLGSDEEGTDAAMQGNRTVVLATSGPKTVVLRYNPDGSLDPSFGGGDGVRT